MKVRKKLKNDECTPVIIIIVPMENHLLRALENGISLQKLKHICFLLILCEKSEILIEWQR